MRQELKSTEADRGANGAGLLYYESLPSRLANELSPSGLTQVQILSLFSREEQRILEHRLQVLGGLCRFLGSDFSMPVILNDPGRGHHWDFGLNVVRVDPIEVLKAPMDELRCIFQHEGGHRRISRTDFIPKDIWQTPGFSLLMNAIEDPRVNSFVADHYPPFRNHSKIAYDRVFAAGKEVDTLAQQTIGTKSLANIAALEYIRAWFLETQGQTWEPPDEIDSRVVEVVRKTIDAAREAWLTYPSMADVRAGEEVITHYAEESYKIVLEKVWPEFQKLVEIDRANAALEEMLQDSIQDPAAIPFDDLSPEEQQELTSAIEKAIEQSQAEESSKPGEESQTVTIPLDSLSEPLRKKLEELLAKNSKREDLSKRGDEDFGTIENKASEALEGKFQQAKEDEEQQDDDASPQPDSDNTTEVTPAPPLPQNLPNLRGKKVDDPVFAERIKNIVQRDRGRYHTLLSETAETANHLENELRGIFTKRRAAAAQIGRKSGTQINITRRVSEVGKGIASVDSRAWETPSLPLESDYAVSILVDTSESMYWQKDKTLKDDSTVIPSIEPATKAVIDAASVLERLRIALEIAEFNTYDQLLKGFTDRLGPAEKEALGNLLDKREGGTNLAYAISKYAGRLCRQKQKQKLLIIITDGMPNDPIDDELAAAMKDCTVIGIGIGPNARKVASLFPNHVVVDDIKELPRELARVLKELIENGK